MENEQLENQSVTEQKNGDDYNTYIEAMKEMKKNMVDKESYDKVVEENKQLINAFVNGEQINGSAQPENIDIDELRNNLFNKEHNNLEYVKLALELRNELIKRGENDPFVASNKNVIPTEEDYKAAQRVANSLQECVDYADGDSNIFTTELSRIMVDSQPIRR